MINYVVEMMKTTLSQTIIEFAEVMFSIRKKSKESLILNQLTEPGISLSVSFVICARVGIDPFLTDFRELSLPRSRDFL